MKNYYHITVKIWGILKPFQKYFYLQLFFIIYIQISEVIVVYLTAKVIDAVTQLNFVLAYQFAGTAFLVYMMRVFTAYFQNANEMKKLDISLFQYLEEYSAKKILLLNPFQYIEDHSAVKFQVIQNGERAIKAIVTVLLLNLIPTFTMIVFSIGAIFFFSTTIATFVLLIAMVVLIWSMYFTNYLRPLLQKNIDNWVENGRQRAEMFTHLSLIRTSGVEDKYVHDRLDERKVFGDYSINVGMQRLSHGQKRFSLFSTSRFVVLFYLIYLASKSMISVGSIYSILTWLMRSYESVFSLVQTMRQVPSNFLEVEKYLKIVEMDPYFDEFGKEKFENGDIVLKNLVFRYPKNPRIVLNNLNLTIKHGTKVAFVGSSGSGKSSIVKLLLRIYDFESGEILIANKNIKNIFARDLRRSIGYVEQHVDLFDSSIKNNILLGANEKNVSEELLQEVIEKSRINEFQERLGKEKLNTLIGERGVKLSGGERQRIGIARALIKNPDILIFDEATASLDTVNEKYIQEAIDESAKGRTTIIVAHRLSTIQNADKIFVINKGEVEAEGKHDELLKISPTYQDLVSHQFTK